MRLSLKRSGGFAGVIKPPQELDTARLPKADRARLEKLVAQVQAAAPASRPAPAMPDRFEYELTIKPATGAQTTMRLPEATMHPAAGRLVELIQSTAGKKM